MSKELFHSIYSYASELGYDRTRKNLLEEIKNKIRKIEIFSAIYINIKVVTTTNSKIGLQRSLQNLMLDFSKKKNRKSVKNSAQKMILNLVFLFHSTVRSRGKAETKPRQSRDEAETKPRRSWGAISPASIIASLAISRIVCIGTYSILCDFGADTSFYAYTRI